MTLQYIKIDKVCRGIYFNVFVHSYSRLWLQLFACQMECTNFILGKGSFLCLFDNVLLQILFQLPNCHTLFF